MKNARANSPVGCFHLGKWCAHAGHDKVLVRSYQNLRADFEENHEHECQTLILTNRIEWSSETCSVNVAMSELK